MTKLQLKPDSMLEVDIPISPQVEQGTITVKIQTISQYSHQDHEVELNILVIKVFNLHIHCINRLIFEQPEGATINRHTSLLLDLKNRANLLRFLDIDVEESPIIPYSKFRRYVYGSPRASVTLCGKQIISFYL
jgi:CD109 antigen